MSHAQAATPAAAEHALADRIGGPLWVVLGAAMAVGAWRLERLQDQGVKWFAAPGLVPGLLGLAIAAAGTALCLRARGQPAPPAGAAWGGEAARIALTLAVCLLYAGVLVGRGLPFALATGLYLFVHIGMLQWHERRQAGQLGRGLLQAAAVALGAAILVPLVFERIFLVRLP